MPRAIGFLQLGFIGGTALGLFFGGQLVSLAAGWPVGHWMGLTIHGWQWVLMMVGAPGFVIAGLLLLAKEPPRRGVMAQGKALPVEVVVREIWARKAIYLPLFIGLAFSATEFLGPAGLASAVPDTDLRLERGADRQLVEPSVPGVFASRGAARYRVRRVAREALQGCQRAGRDHSLHARVPFEIAAPLMPSGELALVFLGVASMWAWHRPYHRTPPSSASRRMRCADK